MSGAARLTSDSTPEQPPAPWDAMLARAETIIANLEPYQAGDGHMSVAAPSRASVHALVDSLRHAVHYARDAEQGNAELRARLDAAEEDAAEGRRLAKKYLGNPGPDVPSRTALVDWARNEP